MVMYTMMTVMTMMMTVKYGDDDDDDTMKTQSHTRWKSTACLKEHGDVHGDVDR